MPADVGLVQPPRSAGDGHSHHFPGVGQVGDEWVGERAVRRSLGSKDNLREAKTGVGEKKKRVVAHSSVVATGGLPVVVGGSLCSLRACVCL